jgi:hypothetical protein
MSDDEEEPLIDDSLLVTNVTAESLGFTVPQGKVDTDPGPGTSKATVVQTTDKTGATILTFPASMELTLQYLSGMKFNNYLMTHCFALIHIVYYLIFVRHVFSLMLFKIR